MFELDLKALCEQVGVSFYDDELVSENGRKIYRVYISKKGGVNIDDCVKLSEILSPILDVKPPCADKYYLEVSSAGLERRLTKLEHFVLSLGEKVILILEDKSKFKGEILSVCGEVITICDENGVKKEIHFSQIKKAKSFVEW